MRIAMSALALATSCAIVAAAGVPAAGAATPESVAGTRWQLARIIGVDDQLTLPDDGSKYTIAFDANGRAELRVDCNRASATWVSPGPGRLQFGPMAATRAMCAGTSLSTRMLRELAAVRTYSIREGHLFLASPVETSAIWEFEAVHEP